MIEIRIRALKTRSYGLGEYNKHHTLARDLAKIEALTHLLSDILGEDIETTGERINKKLPSV